MVRKILVIEDDADIRETLQALLQTLPEAEVTTAQDVATGMVQLQKGPWDMVLSDERLPDGRGVELLAKSSDQSPTTVRVLMSAFHDFDMMLRAVNAAHIDHFILKPYDPEAMLERLEQMLQAHAASAKGYPVRSGPFRRIGAGTDPLPVARREMQPPPGGPRQPGRP